MRKAVVILLLSFSFLFFIPSFLQAEDTSSSSSSSNSSAANDLENKIKEYEQKLTDIRQQKNTLSSQIQEMDTQIFLKTLTIQQTEQKITETQHEIDTLTTRIDGLDSSLTNLSKLLIQRVIRGYKEKSLSVFDLLLSTENMGDFVSKIKYQKATQDNNQKLLIQVQEAKSNYEEQKTLREEKTKELNALAASLESQKAELTNQQKAKQNLLAATQNDEATYQDLLDQARRELSSFSSFVQYAGGGGLTSFGSGSNGWYYTQRDPAWGGVVLPGSSSTLAVAGCAVTSVAMVCKSFGQDISPLSIASNPSNFIAGDLWNWAFSCSGRSSSGFKYMSKDDIKSYIKNNNARVIIRLSAASVSGLHFIVGWKWDDGKDDMIIHDPYYGPDKAFSERYSWDQVTTAIAIY